MARSTAGGNRPSNDLWFTVLGPLSVTASGHPLNLGGAKQQMVLALLLLEVNRIVPVERLIEWVWPDDAQGGTPGGSAGTVQVYVSNLRRILAPTAERLDRQLIATQRPGYSIRLQDDELDLSLFKARQADGEKLMGPGDHAGAIGSFESALSLWTDGCLVGLPIDISQRGVTERYDEARVAALEQLAKAKLVVGQHREILSDLQNWVSENPLNERLRAQLMLALYRSGRQADALGCYQDGREKLLNELGIDPSRELRDLEARILDQDPSLDPSSRSGEPSAKGMFDAITTTKLRSSVRISGAHLDYSGQSVGLDRQLTTIGRLPDRDIVIEDEGVSRRHIEIHKSGDLYRLVDVGSSNGTTVNGHHVAETVLEAGDVIRVGDTELVFRVDGDR